MSEDNKEKPSVASTPAEATADKKAMEGKEPKIEDFQKKVAATKGGEPRPEDSGREELKKQLEDCEKKAAEYLAGWQRERADFLNYKKEEMERIGQLINYAKEELILEILPIMDNFEVIAKKLPDNLQKDENVKGLLQIKIQFQDFLKSLGVEEIKSVGEKFDPKFHESVGEILPSEANLPPEALAKEGAKEGGKLESGIIVEEVQKGYKSNGRLMRPAKVRITK